jgi:hypothetical protein
MANLNLHGSAALAMIVWYLMLPPMTYESASGEPRVASDASLRTWKIIGTYDSAAECHQAAWRGLQNAKNIRQLYPDWPGRYHAAVVKSWFDAVCISADDPLLKEK